MIGRMVQFARKAGRNLVNKRQAEPDLQRSITSRKVFTGSWSQLANLPSLGSDVLQDPSTGKLIHLTDYDALP